jgi:Tfp pilus assembly protein PilO
VSRSLRLLIAVVVAFGAVGGYWKLVLAPKRAEVATLDQQVATKQAELTQTQGLIATDQGARVAYKTNYSTVVRLGKAVPTDDDTHSLVVQVDAAAKRSGVNFDTIASTASGGGSDATGENVAPGAINAGSFSAMPFSFAFSGTFDTLGNFFSRIENFVSLQGDKILVNGRLMRVESIAVKPGDTGWPSLVAQVGASSYIVPEATDPATAPSTPSTTPGTGNTEASASATPATTTNDVR